MFNNINVMVLIVIGLSAGVIWQRLPEPEAPKSLTVVAEPWRLPTLPETDLRKSAETITAKNLWGAVIPAQQVPLNDPEWHFVGAVKNGPEHYVLIRVEQNPVETLKVGDSLPGGAKILKIGEDRLCVLVNGKKRALGIYRQ